MSPVTTLRSTTEEERGAAHAWCFSASGTAASGQHAHTLQLAGRPPVAASQEVLGILDARVHRRAYETALTFFLRLASQVQSSKENYLFFQGEEETVLSE